jgi:hypothetical protein
MTVSSATDAVVETPAVEEESVTTDTRCEEIPREQRVSVASYS